MIDKGTKIRRIMRQKIRRTKRQSIRQTIDEQDK